MQEKQKNIKKYTLNKNKLPLLSEEEAQYLDKLQDEDIDYSEIPDLSENPEFWTTAELAVRQRKKQITLRLDADVIK